MRQWTVDAFAAEPFRGNPACVVEPLDAWPDAAWMQALAAENNQAETAYLLRTADPARFGLRWFTPTLEVPLCGHATLASAHVLMAETGLDTDRVAFETRHRGVLTVARDGDAYVMDLPADPPRRTATPEGLARALGAEPAEVWAASYLVAVLADEAAVRALKPDISALGLIAGEATGGRGNVAVCAAAAANDRYEVVDRFFAPGSGIAEDPATGSAHCILAPLWADRLGVPRVRFHQAFPGRGADIGCEVQGDRTRMTGQARTVVESRLRLQPPSTRGCPDAKTAGPQPWAATRPDRLSAPGCGAG